MATILICDNEAVLRTLVRDSLSGNGYEIVEAADGDESVALARDVRPDLVFLDMMMPGRTGVEVLRELRADPDLEDVPVVMLTASAQAADREEAERAGATAFVSKPFSPVELARAAERLLQTA